MSNEYKDWLNEEKQDRDKFLTEAMGECWHDFFRSYSCMKCGAKITDYPNYSTWEGFGKLWEWSKSQWWSEIIINRLPIKECIDPDPFADSVYVFLKEREER